MTTTPRTKSEVEGELAKARQRKTEAETARDNNTTKSREAEALKDDLAKRKADGEVQNAKDKIRQADAEIKGLEDKLRKLARPALFPKTERGRRGLSKKWLWGALALLALLLFIYSLTSQRGASSTPPPAGGLSQVQPQSDQSAELVRQLQEKLDKTQADLAKVVAWIGDCQSPIQKPSATLPAPKKQPVTTNRTPPRAPVAPLVIPPLPQRLELDVTIHGLPAMNPVSLPIPSLSAGLDLCQAAMMTGGRVSHFCKPELPPPPTRRQTSGCSKGKGCR